MTNGKYQMTWITSDLAVGYAPMSYAELDSIKSQGIDAIVNLCAEFCDLHELEEASGFEVYYLPILDETAPDMEEMEKGLAWLDEAIYLGKKVLIHCRHGIGRTGTFLTSYLLRRGLGLKLASKKLKYTRAAPTNYSQWRLLKKYGKKSGVLKIREPSLESRNVVDLSSYFTEYEALIQKIDENAKKADDDHMNRMNCGLETDDCCFEYVELKLIEAIYLNNKINRILKSDVRSEVIHNAVDVFKKIGQIRRLLDKGGDDPGADKQNLIETYNQKKILCPLNRRGRCSIYEYRPIQCRLFGVSENVIDLVSVHAMLFNISKNVFFAFSGSFLEKDSLSFSLAETVSGKFVQEYFHYLAYLATASND
jgi:protein-tyrosine phosphatase/Fe-S-cluster containining protein